MGRYTAFKFLFLIVFKVLLYVNSQKTGSELRDAEERNPSEIFMKDEPRRQDSNEESLGAMHLCMEEEDQKERLITCDRRYSSKFACVGAWEGNIQKCDKFNEKQVAAAICVQDNSSNVLICEKKELNLSYLCFTRKLTWVNDFNEYRNASYIPIDLREGIRPCSITEQRICLKHGKIIPCIDVGQSRLGVDNFSANVMLNSTTLDNNSGKNMAYKQLKIEFDDLRFQSAIENTAYLTQNDSTKSKSFSPLDYRKDNLESNPTSDMKIPYLQKNALSSQLYEGNERKSPFLLNNSNTHYNTPIFPVEAGNIYKGKYKAIDILSLWKTSDSKKLPSILTNTAFKMTSNSSKTEGQYRSSSQNIMNNTSKYSDEGQNNPNMMYKTVNLLSNQRGELHVPNLQQTTYAPKPAKYPMIIPPVETESLAKDVKYMSSETKADIEKLVNDKSKMQSKLISDGLEQTSKLAFSSLQELGARQKRNTKRNQELNLKFDGLTTAYTEERPKISKLPGMRHKKIERNHDDPKKTSETNTSIERIIDAKSKIQSKLITDRLDQTPKLAFRPLHELGNTRKNSAKFNQHPNSKFGAISNVYNKENPEMPKLRERRDTKKEKNHYAPNKTDETKTAFKRQVNDKSRIKFNLITDGLDQTSKLAFRSLHGLGTKRKNSPKRVRLPESKSGGLSTVETKERPKMHKLPERRHNNIKRNHNYTKKAFRQMTNILYRDAKVRRPEKPSAEKTVATQEGSEERSFFYVLKCKDCDIDNVMAVDKAILGDNPAVETFTFKS